MMLSLADSPGRAIGTPGRYLLTHLLFLPFVVPKDGRDGILLPALLLAPPPPPPPPPPPREPTDEEVIR